MIPVFLQTIAFPTKNVMLVDVLKYRPLQIHSLLRHCLAIATPPPSLLTSVRSLLSRGGR
jgi:hypothetical protein